MTTRPLIVLPEFCFKHQRTVVRRLGIGPSGQWAAAMVTANFLMFRALSGEESIAAQAHYKGSELPHVFKALGCLACYRYVLFTKAIELMKRKGIKYASGVAQGKIPNDKWHK